MKRVTIDKDRLQQESAGYKEITELLKYKLENLKQDISSQNEMTKRLEEQLDQLDTKYTEALDRIQTLELSSTNLDKENEYLKQINHEVINILEFCIYSRTKNYIIFYYQLMDKINNKCTSSTSNPVNVTTVSLN